MKQLKKDIDDFKAMLGAQKGNEDAKSVNNNRTAHKVTTTTGSKKSGEKDWEDNLWVWKIWDSRGKEMRQP